MGKAAAPVTPGKTGSPSPPRNPPSLEVGPQFGDALSGVTDEQGVAVCGKGDVGASPDAQREFSDETDRVFGHLAPARPKADRRVGTHGRDRTQSRVKADRVGAV